MAAPKFNVSAFLWWILLFVLLVAGGHDEAPIGPALALNAVFFFLTAQLSVLAHEAGHALAARAAGIRAFILMVGTGHLIVDRVIGGVHVQIRAFPAAGLTMLAAKSLSWLRLRLLPTYAAGLIVNFAILFAVVSAAGGVHVLIFPSLAQRFHPLSTIFAVNAFLIFTSLIPAKGKSSTTGAVALTDMRRILGLPFLTLGQREMILDAYPVLEGSLLLRQGRQAELAPRAREILARDPDHLFGKLMLSEALLATRDYAAARSLYLELLQVPALAASRPIIANNAAWTSLMLDRDDLLAEADTLSAQAIQGAPSSPAVVGTRAMVLTLLGRLDEAAPLLERTAAPNTTAKNRAYNACARAILAARQGDAAAARRWVDTAEQLDPTCDLLPRARAGQADR